MKAEGFQDGILTSSATQNMFKLVMRSNIKPLKNCVSCLVSLFVAPKDKAVNWSLYTAAIY